MADKEATVYIVDLGSTMGEQHEGRTMSDLDWAMQYVWDKICTTVAASRKTWTVGVVGLRTDETRNAQQDEDGYEHIAVLQEIEPMSLAALRKLRARLQQPTKTPVSGDAVSAVIVATDMLSKAAPKRLKYNRKIVLVTDGQGPMDGDDLDDLAFQLNDLGIQLVVVGVDFDDADYGYKQEDKPPTKRHNERLLETLVGKCDNGVFGTMAEAIGELQRPSVKPTRPYKTFDGPLTLGDPTQYESALSIQVERYFVTKTANPPPATTVVVRDAGATQSTHTLDEMQGVETVASADMAAVQNARTYYVEDHIAPGGKKQVDFECLEKGYEYGRTAVHFSSSDLNVTQLSTTKSFSILGFISQDNVEPFLSMGESCVILPQRFNERDELAFTALVQAMVDTRTCAVARFVAKDNKDPLLLLLLPTLTESLACLYDVPLPFAEDVRIYAFPPLDKVITATGATLTKHRLLPGDDLNKAMSDYVDAMDLSTFGTDDDGQAEEYAEVTDNYSPIIYRVNKALIFRAVHPDEPFVHVDDDFVTRFDHPPADLVLRAGTEIASLIKAADVKKVPPKAKGRAARASAANKPISGLDVDALLGISPGAGGGGGGGVRKPAKISMENSIPEFKQALAGTVDLGQIDDITQQMGEIVRTLIATSTGDINYARATENIRVMREELISLEEPGLYNKFMTDLKSRLVAEALGGPRLEMWWSIRTGGLGLITKIESEQSDISDTTAFEFIRYFKATENQ